MTAALSAISMGLKRRLTICVVIGFIVSTFVAAVFCWDVLRDDPQCGWPMPARSFSTPSMLRSWEIHALEHEFAPAPTYQWRIERKIASISLLAAPAGIPGSPIRYDVLVRVESGWPWSSIQSSRWQSNVPAHTVSALRDTIRLHPLTYTPDVFGVVMNTLIFSLYPLFSSLLIDGLRWLNACNKELLKRQREREAAQRLLCPECSYDLRGAPNAGCPECGWRRESS